MTSDKSVEQVQKFFLILMSSFAAPQAVWGAIHSTKLFRNFRSKTQWIGSVQAEKFRKNGSTFWGGPLFPVGPVGILVEWIAPMVFMLARKLSCIEWAPFHLSFRESCLFHILPPMPTSLHWWDWKKPQESLQRTSAKNKQQHSWVSFGPTFQLHWPQYFWCPGAWHGVALCSGTNIQRKQREMRLTFQLGTVQPKGLNINFSFLWIGTLCSSCASYHTTSSPVLFPQKRGGAGKGPFPAPPIFWGKSPGDEVGYYMRAYIDHFYAVYEIRSSHVW